jgi:hypothetical protein
VDNKVGVVGEEGHLSLGVPAIRAVGAGFDGLADGETVGGLCGSQSERCRLKELMPLHGYAVAMLNL